MTSHGIHTVPRRRVGAALAALALAAASVFLIGGPASAHDELLGSDPAADAAVDALPAELVLTFSAAIATDPGASVVEVTDAAGTMLADGEPVAQDNTLTQPLAGEASGTITVLWKVVSSDGHPISGEYAFEVTAPPAPTETAEPEPTETAEPEPTEEPTEEPTAAPTTVPAGDEEDSTFGDVWPWVIGGLLLAGLAGAVLYLVVSRQRRDAALAENRERALGGGETGGDGGGGDGPANGSSPQSDAPSER